MPYPSHEQLSGFPDLLELSQPHQAVIAVAGEPASYPKRWRLFSPNDPAQGCWLVRNGRVAIDLFDPAHGQLVVDVVGPGQIVGWSWLLAPYRWRFGAVTETTVDAILLDTGKLTDAAEKDAEFGRALYRLMLGVVAERLEHARHRLVETHRPQWAVR